MSVGELLETSANSLSFLRSPGLNERVSIKIQDKKLLNWKGLSLKYEVDSPCAAASFTTVFNPDDKDSRELFQPMSKRKIEILVDDVIILSGSLDIIAPAKAADGISVNVQCRSDVSYIVDSDIIGNVYFKNLTLQTYANKIADGDRCKFEPDTPPIPVIKAEKGETIFESIAKEAGSRGYWCVPGIKDVCNFVKISSSDEIKAELKEGVAPVISVDASYDLTKRYTDYVIVGSGNGKTKSLTVLDDSLKGFSEAGIKRYRIVKAKKENSDYKLFGERARNQDQIDSITINVELSSWFFNNKLWQPSAMIQLEAPGAMIYKASKFVIKSVELSLDEDGEKCNLGLALPNAFDGSTVKNEPWILNTPVFRGLLAKVASAFA